MLNTQSMNLDLIRTFVIVGQSKDFNDAASKLKIDATNVSRHIKTLEQLMGTKLINKNAKNYIELTEDGQILFDGYEKAYNLLFITLSLVNLPSATLTPLTNNLTYFLLTTILSYFSRASSIDKI